ncbi:hypothetical protein A3A74_04440 [Candidatus Roizmanbacteria bacterium RIFCSPLOWO2_01_FULL_35_13]|uniref:methionyl-tRNA formyltransferase n=1 Tax=Candidatus Roizmanbacteria bacterium RIFCSPLOWO2_01_FULL_35_13 TaxID=1802055 RepID=A0A1F7I8N1_9BACT|nr:MAG: hypothetical protein A3A74_04440 [Candidatus Roizmanbacteria bacterium RIFCSPLOWO2_01_FULL_35_13]
MNKLKIAYFGTPYVSSRFLEKLLTDTSIKRLIEVKFVITQSDKPVGKEKIITPSPVKKTANKYSIKVYDQNVKDIKDKIKKLDFVLIYAYGFKQYIPADILSLPKIKFSDTNSGFINIHPSLLPLYRGASPIAYPLILGDKKTGVSIFVLDEKMDHGPILAQEKINIEPNDMRSDLEVKLTDLGFEMFKRMILNNDSGVVPTLAGLPGMTATVQDHSKTTHARFLTKDDGFIPLPLLKQGLDNLTLSFNELPNIIKEFITKYSVSSMTRSYKDDTYQASKIIFNLFHGLYPWPSLWTLVRINGIEKRLKIIDMRFKSNQLSNQASKLTIHRVQLEGKKEVDFKTFNSAYAIF